MLKAHAIERGEMGRRRSTVWVFLVLAWPLSSVAWAAEPHPLVYAQRGTLPILLTAPHGGQKAVPGVPDRKTGKRNRDVGTLEIARAVEERIAASGSRPYVVAALFHRKYIDANRREPHALESPAAWPAYRAYHAQIREFITEIRQRFPAGGLLLDLHGQATEPELILRGTQNHKTVVNLVRRHGVGALVGDDSLFGFLEARGYRVYPARRAADSVRENPKYNGGFTVQTYGSHLADGIDAIQMEIGQEVRKRPGLAEDMAAAIMGFARKYLSAGKG